MYDPQDYSKAPITPRNQTYDGQPANQLLIDLIIAVQASGTDRGRHEDKNLAQRRDHFAAQVSQMSPDSLQDYTRIVTEMALERNIDPANPTDRKSVV